MSALTMIAPPTPPRTRERTIGTPAPDPHALATLRLAAHHYEKTRRLHAEVWAASEAAGDDGRWAMVAGNLWSEAETNLVNAILASDPALPDREFRQAAEKRRPARGVRIGNRLYLAIVDPHLGPDTEPRTGPAMRLAVVELDSILSLDAK